MIKILLSLFWICGSALALTTPFTITSNTESPGPSATLFNTPYYSCATNRYVSTTGSNSNDGTASDNAHAWLTIAHADAAVPSAGWCITVGNGTYATGVTITHGGNNASASGYVVYKCATLNGCTITDTGNQTYNSAINVSANYVMIDGFILNGGNGTGVNTVGIVSCVDSSCGYGRGNIGFQNHHIWELNNIISGYGQAGSELANGDYFYLVHNTYYNNAHDCQAAQGSGVSLFLPVLFTPYTPTSDDGNNLVTGNTGSLFRMFVMWNVFYNNYIGCSSPPVTDGNGLILDDWQGDQFSAGAVNSVYLGGGLIAFNITYNNGGIGIHPFEGAYITVVNNSAYNNVIDTVSTNQGFRGNIDDDGSYGGFYANNISYGTGGAGILASNSAIGIYGLDGGSNYVASTTLSAAITTTTATSISITSAVGFPGGSTFNSTVRQFNGSYALPGGNLIKIDSEIMWVQGGWGTTTWTVQRGFNGTTAATHLVNATVQWIQGYYSNNVTLCTPSCTNEIDIQGSSSNAYYSATANKKATNPSWVNVGNTSAGSESTPPNGSNFALSGGSAAIGYGQTFSWLSAQSVDAGACWHTLSTCP